MEKWLFCWSVGQIFCMNYMFLRCNALSIQDEYAWRNDCLGGQWERFSAWLTCFELAGTGSVHVELKLPDVVSDRHNELFMGHRGVTARNREHHRELRGALHLYVKMEQWATRVVRVCDVHIQNTLNYINKFLLNMQHISLIFIS